MNTDSRKYFASANSHLGFYSLFSDIFPPERLDAIYIIKGGPGTGKSTFMKKIGERAETYGLAPEYVLCSSDPCSLDGIIIPEMSAAVLDGTSPHVTEPKYPVAVERILDFYKFIDRKKISPLRFAIMEETAAAERETKLGYGFLRALGEVKKDEDRILDALFDTEKAHAAAKKMIGGIHTSEDKKTVFGGAVCYEGEVFTDSYFSAAKTRYAVTGKYGAEKFFLSALCRAADEAGVGYTRLLDPAVPDTVCGIYFEEPKIIFSSSDEKNAEISDKRINAMRFFDAEGLSAARGRLRFARRCGEALLEGAAEGFARAREHHAELEKIYGAATDFSGIDALCEKICGEMFCNLKKMN